MRGQLRDTGTFLNSNNRNDMDEITHMVTHVTNGIIFNDIEDHGIFEFSMSRILIAFNNCLWVNPHVDYTLRDFH